MIRINLAKSVGAKKGIRTGSPFGALTVVLLLLIVLGGGGYYYMVYINGVAPDDLIDAILAGDFGFTKSQDAAASGIAVSSALDKLVESASDDDTDADAPKKKSKRKAAPDVLESVESQAPEKPAPPVPEKAVAVAPPAPEKVAPPPPPPPPPPPEPEKPQAPIVAKTEPRPARPSSMVRTNMVEDVVRELGNESRMVSKLSASYSEMTVAEKINYEVLFARNAFNMVTRSTPPGIKLRTLEIENFQTVYASGHGASREMVQEMFGAFRNERGELMPRPLSYIKDDGKGGFQFVITFKPRYGLELSDPFQALDHLGFKESLATHLKKFTRIAGTSGFKMTGNPTQASAERTGNYRRMVYKVSGTTTYGDFKKFVSALYDEKVPCAFKKISMTPVKDEVIRVNAEVLFTVKN